MFSLVKLQYYATASDCIIHPRAFLDTLILSILCPLDFLGKRPWIPLSSGEKHLPPGSFELLSSLGALAKKALNRRGQDADVWIATRK